MARKKTRLNVLEGIRNANLKPNTTSCKKSEQQKEHDTLPSTIQLTRKQMISVENRTFNHIYASLSAQAVQPTLFDCSNTLFSYMGLMSAPQLRTKLMLSNRELINVCNAALMQPPVHIVVRKHIYFNK